jgi:hypothetical protein
VNRPSTAREALIAEAIGDVAQLLDRVEALMQGMEGARQAQAATAIELGRQLGAVDSYMAAITDRARTRAVEHIVRRTNEVAARSLEAQTRAMTDAARSLFDEEVDATLQRLCMSLQRLVERVDRPWERWATHGATALVASAAAWGLAWYLFR